MGQDKARPAGNSSSIFKGRNAVLTHLWGSLRARLWGRAAALRSLELAPASPALARLATPPHSRAEMQRIYASGYN
jgi:hypothetical protein